MKYFLSLSIFVFAFLLTKAQHTVVFKLKKHPSLHTDDNIFIAGNFNEWNPHNNDYRLRVNWDNIFELIVQLPVGQYEYKCARGNWDKVECLNDGKDIGNRFLTIQADTIIEINIEAWKDDFALVTKEHTASKQVHIIDTAFFIPQLNRTRRIWVYLPEDYSKNKKNYPVMYMHDGQNIFDTYTSGFGEWGVDECLDSLIMVELLSSSGHRSRDCSLTGTEYGWMLIRW